MRQRGNYHRAVFFLPHRAHAHGAAPVFINFTNLGARGNDFRFGRVVRAVDNIQHLVQRGFRLLNQGDRGFCHFTQVVRRNIGRHADRDTGCTVKQDVRQTRRQHFRLLHCSVEVWHPVSGSLAEFTQQQFGVSGQAGFGITHRREGFRIVRRPPVPLAINQRITVRERLRHQHHGLIAGAVSVRVVFTQHVADGTGGFFKFGAGIQPQL